MNITNGQYGDSAVINVPIDLDKASKHQQRVKRAAEAKRKPKPEIKEQGTRVTQRVEETQPADAIERPLVVEAKANQLANVLFPHGL